MARSLRRFFWPAAAAFARRQTSSGRHFPSMPSRLKEPKCINLLLLFVAITRQPSAFLPMAMSLIALALVLGNLGSDLIQNGHILREADEGTTAHLWQLLMVGQLPVLAFFAIKWLPRAPGQTLKVLALQAGAVLANLAVVFFSGVG